jgi:hypothetical protein
MVRVCGKLGSRVCGLLGSVCGSVGIAVLVVALAALATHHAYAEDPLPPPDPCPCLPEETWEECQVRCAAQNVCPGHAICNINCRYDSDMTSCQGGCRTLGNCIACGCKFKAFERKCVCE